MLLVFNLAFTALWTESKLFGTVSSFSCFCSNFCFFLEMYFVIVKLSTELKQTVLYYVNRLMLKGAMIDINCNPLVEPKIIHLLCTGVLFVLVLKFLFDILLRLLSEDLEALLFISLLNTRSETEWNLLDNWEWIVFKVLGKIFERFGE